MLPKLRGNRSEDPRYRRIEDKGHRIDGLARQIYTLAHGVINAARASNDLWVIYQRTVQIRELACLLADVTNDVEDMCKVDERLGNEDEKFQARA